MKNRQPPSKESTMASKKNPGERTAEEAALAAEREAALRPLLESMQSMAQTGSLERVILNTQRGLQQLARPLSLAGKFLTPTPLLRNLEYEMKGEQAAREIAQLELLEAIHRDLQEQGARLEKIEEKVQEHDMQIARLRTGAPGRPTAMPLVQAEFGRRARRRAIEPTLAEQARVLATWLISAHPDAAPLTEKAIKNKLRDAYRRAKSTGAESQN